MKKIPFKKIKNNNFIEYDMENKSLSTFWLDEVENTWMRFDIICEALVPGAYGWEGTGGNGGWLRGERTGAGHSNKQ